MRKNKTGWHFKKLADHLVSLCIAVIIGLSSMGCEQAPISFSDRMTNLVPSQGVLSPEFSTLVLLYDLEVDSNTESITFTPTLAGENITVTVNDVIVESGFASQQIMLTGGRTEIKIDVDTDSINYNYVITVNNARNANAFLSDLTLSEGQFSPSLEQDIVSITGYEVTVPYLSSSISLTATLADENASFTINGANQVSGEPSSDIILSEGDNIIDIVVTAQNEIMQQIYQLKVKRSIEEAFAHYTYFKATNTDAGDEFGAGVAMWGNTLVIGAPGEGSSATSVNGDQTNNSAIDKGAAYVYEKDEEGIWNFHSYLKPSGDVNRFAFRTAIYGDNIAVRAATETGEGVINIFRKNSSGDWSSSHVIDYPNGVDGFSFGGNLILFNNTLFISAATDVNGVTDVDDPDYALYENSGAVFVFKLSDNIDVAPILTDYIVASDRKRNDYFGSSMALSGSTLAIGLTRGGSGGSVYIYTFKDDGWSEQKQINETVSFTGNPSSFTPLSLSLSGDTLAIGKHTTGTYSSLIFTRGTSSNWTQQAYLEPDNYDRTAQADRFGSPVFISGDTLVVGSSFEDSASSNIDGATNRDSPDSGAAYLFTRDEAGLWTQKHFIKAPNTDSNDQFAGSFAGYSNNLLFSSIFEDSNATFNTGGESDNSSGDAGAAYLYHNAPFSNHNLALTVIANTNSSGSIQGINQDTGIALTECLNDCSQLVDRNQTIQLIPVPENGASKFDHWEGDPVCLVEPDENGSILVTILAETYCKVAFSEKEIRLTLVKDVSSTATGTIEATDNGSVVVTCDFDCDLNTSEPIDIETTIQIIATAEDGAFVAAWSGDAECQNNATNLNTVTTVTMNESKTCTALFNFPETRTLRLTVDTLGGSTGLISAINQSTSTNLEGCTTDCSQQVIKGHTVQLTATAGDGSSEFINWEGDNECTANANGSNITSVNLNEDVQCIAVFAEIVIEEFILTVTKNPDSNANGTIQGTSNDGLIVNCDINCNSADSGLLTDGSLVQLTAIPESGAFVSAWSGDTQCQTNASADNATTSVTMNASKTCTARFELEAADIILTINKAASSTADGLIQATDSNSTVVASCDVGCATQDSLVLAIDSVITLTANPEPGAFVSAWTGDEQCQTNANADNTSTSVTMSVSKTCTVQFDTVATSGLSLHVANSLGSSGRISATNLDTGEVYPDCLTDCTEQITTNQSVELRAIPAELSQFTSWTGDAGCTDNVNINDVATVVISTDTDCTANFTVPDTGDITITISKASDQTGDGTISAVLFDFLLIECAEGCTSATSVGVDPDSFILIFATPDSLSEFVEWTGDVQCAENASGTQTSVTLDVAKTCTAKFDSLPVSVN